MPSVPPSTSDPNSAIASLTGQSPGLGGGAPTGPSTLGFGLPNIPQTGLTTDIGQAIKDITGALGAPRRFGEDIGKKAGEYAFKPTKGPEAWQGQPTGSQDWMTGGQAVSPTAMDPNAAAPADAAAAPGTSATTPSGATTTFSVPGPAGGGGGVPSGYWGTVDKAEGRGINPRSSAFGPGQFIDSTFKDYMKDAHPEIDISKMSHAQLNEYKNVYGQDATTWYASQNAPKLAGANIPVTNGSLYGAHFLGPEGLIKLWSAPDNTPVAQILDKSAIAANPEVLSGKTVGQVKGWLENKNHVIPQQQPLTEPPGQPPLPTSNLSIVRRLMGDTNVTPSEHTANVLAGLAGGAGSVASNAPGSFASALAAAGAGGGKGYAQSFASQRAARQGQAETETKLLSIEHQQAKDNAEIAYQNAQNLWKIKNENAQRDYENKSKEFEFMKPKIDVNAAGIVTAQQYNPQTGQYDITQHNPKTAADQAEKAKQVIDAMGGEGPVAEMYGLHAIANSYANIKDPILKSKLMNEAATQYSIGRIVRSGAGRQVFDKYDQYEKEAQKQLESSLPAGGAAALAATKPKDYQEMLQSLVISRILADPDTRNYKWAKKGGVYSPSAGLLSQNIQEPGGTTPMTKPQGAAVGY
jgi:hypothetical protein